MPGRDDDVGGGAGPVVRDGLDCIGAEAATGEQRHRKRARRAADADGRCLAGLQGSADPDGIGAGQPQAAVALEAVAEQAAVELEHRHFADGRIRAWLDLQCPVRPTVLLDR